MTDKTISFILFGFFFLYQMFGVMIHKQYGFGFFYWPVQLYILAFISFLVLLSNSSILKSSTNLILFNLYFISILSFQLLYLLNDSLDLFYLSNYEIIEIIVNTVLWYFIALVMAFYYDKILSFLTTKKLLTIYILIIFVFIMYIIKLNSTFSSDISRAFWIGANFPTLSIAKLSDSGYVKGFHLYFSPLFAIFSMTYIFILKKEKKERLSYLIFFISIYILFLASGRGSLLSFIFVTSLFLFDKNAKIYFILIFVFLFFIFTNTDILSLLSEKNQRLYDILTLNFNEDKSSAGRLRQLEYNMNYIYDNWYTGGLRSYYAILGKGEYIHNILGVLQEYGFIPFSILIIMFFHGLFLCFKVTSSNDYMIIIAKAIFLYMLIESLFFKHISEIKILIPIIIGYSYLIKIKKSKERIC